MLALKAENISKQYRLGQVGTGTLSHDLRRFWHQARGKEDPYLKIGEANDRASKGESEYVWSLRDINFEIEQGDAVGIIGRNGAGKSTLLKLLSKVTKPTTGKIYTNGRIASLLEVGTGFHPEMTGRENIYLNGAILGMSRKEIKRKFDEIVDFSGVERYIDTPVKRYSSGMYVRLAFAVAANLESEILIVDEVLAVGDAEFQKKCLGKMGDVSKGEGRTVLFVSHNMGSVMNLCDKGVLMDQGETKMIGDINYVIKEYLTGNLKSIDLEPNTEKKAYLEKIRFFSKENNSVIKTGSTAVFEIHIKSTSEIKNIFVGFGINDYMDNRITTPLSLNSDMWFDLKEGDNIINCEIPVFPLKPGNYSMDMYISTKHELLDHYTKGISFSVENLDFINFKYLPESSAGNIMLQQKWY